LDIIESLLKQEKLPHVQKNWHFVFWNRFSTGADLFGHNRTATIIDLY